MGRKHSFIRRNQITFVLVILFTAYVGVTWIKQEVVLRELRYENTILQEEMDGIDVEIAKLEEEIEESSDIDYVEKIAREKLKMVKSNEIIYIIQDENDE